MDPARLGTRIGHEWEGPGDWTRYLLTGEPGTKNGSHSPGLAACTRRTASSLHLRIEVSSVFSLLRFLKPAKRGLVLFPLGGIGYDRDRVTFKLDGLSAITCGEQSQSQGIENQRTAISTHLRRPLRRRHGELGISHVSRLASQLVPRILVPILRVRIRPLQPGIVLP